MAAPSEESRAQDPLVSVLRDAEAELKRRLADACESEASGAPSDSTAEIRRLEDTLLAAAVAAGQTVALRQHIEDRKARDAEAAAAPAPQLSVREFRDANGQLWRAWPVIPGQARGGRTAHRYLGDFHKGWICFEALASSARRRLPEQPAAWADLPDSELARLLDLAISAPERRVLADRHTREAAGG